jgi:hypothetical protein
MNKEKNLNGTFLELDLFSLTFIKTDFFNPLFHGYAKNDLLLIFL